MAKLQRQVGTTSQVVDILALNSSVTTGAGLTGLAYNTSSLTCYYHRNTASADVAVSLATMTLGTWATGGFIVVDGTNMPGLYQFGIPNAALASGADSVVFYFTGATNLAPIVLEIELTATSNQDAVHGGMSALPNTACTTNASLLTSGTGTDQISVSSGKTLLQATQTGVTIPTVTTVTNQLTAAAIATGVWQDATSGDFTTASSIGKSLYTSGAVPGATNGLFIAGTNAATSITTGLTAHIIGTVDTVTTVTNQLTAAAIATGVWQDATAGDFTTSSSIGKSLYNAFTAGTSVFTTASLVNAPTGGSAPTVAQIATAVWQDATAGDFTTSGSIGKSLFTSGAVPGAAGGLFIAGTNAATTITTSLTTHLIGTVDTVTTVTNQLAASAIATAVWQDATAGDFTTSSSIGKSLYNAFTAGTSVFTTASLVNAPIGGSAPTAAQIATAVWSDTTSGDFSTASSPGKILVTQLGGAFTTTSSSVYSTASLANAPTGGSAPTTAQIATAVWQDTTAGDFTTSGSIGKSLFTSGAAPGAAGGLFIAGTNAATTANITGNISGSVGSVTSAVNVNLSETLNAARALDSIADTSLTLNDAFHCAIAGAAGQQSTSGTTYVVETPHTGTPLRTFTLTLVSPPSTVPSARA